MRTVTCLFLSILVALPMVAAGVPAAAVAKADGRPLIFPPSNQGSSCRQESPSIGNAALPNQPTPLTTLTDCVNCGYIRPNPPEFACGLYCGRRGQCEDQCYADASTCALVICICLSC
jgi:hypothetical protein